MFRSRFLLVVAAVSVTACSSSASPTPEPVLPTAAVATTPNPTPVIAATPTAAPTPTPTAAPTATPTATPTPTPTPTPTALARPGAPGHLKSWITAVPDAARLNYSWSKPAGQVDGYYLKAVFYEPGVDPLPQLTACKTNWSRLKASATAWYIDVQDGAFRVFLCAYNHAGGGVTVAINSPTD